MKSKPNAMLLILLFSCGCLWGGACSDDDNDAAKPVFSVYDQTVDFTLYKTFTIMGPEDGDTPDGGVPDTDSSLVDGGPDDGGVGPDINDLHNITEGDRIALNTAIQNELIALGLTPVPEGGDLKIGYFVKVKNVPVEVTGYWYEYYWGWYWGYYEEWFHEDIVNVDLGTLVIDAVDAKDKTHDEDDLLVFRGAAVGLMPEEIQDVKERIEIAVRDIFQQWPTRGQQK